jgi:hypothetical protein
MKVMAWCSVTAQEQLYLTLLNFTMLHKYIQNRDFFFTHIIINKGAGIAQWYSTGLQAGWLLVWVLAGAGNFSLHHHVRLPLGPTYPPIQWVPRALSLRVKWPGHEADHLPPYSTEVKNAWSYTSVPQYTFMVWCSVKKNINI